MDRSEALADLDSSSAHVRLRAARYLAVHAEPEDEESLKRALRLENVTWITKALSDAVHRIGQGFIDLDPKPESPGNDDDLFNQAHAIAVESTTRLLLHEIEPIVGMVRIALRSEIDDHENSRSWQALDKLEALLHAIARLSKSAGSPRLRDFDLSETIELIVRQEAHSTQLSIELTGRQPLVVSGDHELVELVIRNGLRNAIEAVEEMDPSLRSAVVVSWGDTDVDYWVSIMDRGLGLPVGSHRVWDIGSSTKKGHLGMGLPIALQAAKSLDGTLTLTPRSGSGVRFEFRWPVLSKAKS